MPADVGLPNGGRRRTPGLRREEVALLSGVSTTWYTWLEQARDVKASRQVLEALARALQLSPEERMYLFALAGQAVPAVGGGATEVVHPTVLALLAALDPHPAYVANPSWDILAYNRAQAALMLYEYDDLPAGERNAVWLMFTDPAMRRLHLDWEHEARAMVAKFRATAAAADNSRKQALTEALLAASQEFRTFWAAQEVAGHEPATKRLAHPQGGLLTLHYARLSCLASSGQVLTTFLPADDQTATKLPLLVAGALGHQSAR